MSKENRQERTGAAPLDVIRVETALSRFPIHRLAKQGIVDIELREADDGGAVTLRWEVSYNSKYGQPGPLAYKLDTLIVNRRIEGTGRPTPKLVRLGSLSDICRELGLIEGGKIKGDIKRALYQNASAFITAKIGYRAGDGTGRTLEAGFTRYHVVLTGERLPDGRAADAAYLVLSDIYMQVIDSAQARPLDYDYLRGLPPAAQRWYELASYQMFAALKNNRPKARLGYAEYCAYAPQARYADFGRVKKQMYKVTAPHREAGYIADVAYEATTDRAGRPDWIMIYTPGPKAEAEFRAFAQRGRAELVAEVPGPPPAGLEAELVARGVTRAVAAELVRAYPEAHVRAKVEQVDWRRERQEVADVGAYLVDAIRRDHAPPAGFAGAAERARRAGDPEPFAAQVSAR